MRRPLALTVLCGFVAGTALCQKPNLYPFFEAGKWGYLNSSGKVSITAQFRFARPFKEGLAVVRDESNRWMFIDEMGDRVIDLGFGEEPRDFAEGYLASVGSDHTGRSWGYRGRNGEFVIASQFEQVRDFKEGVAAISIDGKWHFIDRSGKRAFAGDFDSAESFQEGLALIGRRALLGFIDHLGNFAIAPQFGLAKSFSEGLAAVAPSKSSPKWGYINASGKAVIPYQFDRAESFSEGLAAVRVSGGGFTPWAYIDSSGSFGILARFREAGPFRHGLAAVINKESWNAYGYIDRKGGTRISALFDLAEEFSRDGVARVSLLEPDSNPQPGSGHGKTWSSYIDDTGRILWNYRQASEK